MNLKIVVSLGLALSLARAANADLSITVGNYLLQPNMPGQSVNIYVGALGGEVVHDLIFLVQVGDGGPLAGGLDVAPPISGSITDPGMLFASPFGPVHYENATPLILDVEAFVLGGSLTMPAGLSLLGKVTFDTTGFGPGDSWPLLLRDTLLGDTRMEPYLAEPYGNGDLHIENGSITIVPEPGSRALAVLGLVGLFIWGAGGWRRWIATPPAVRRYPTNPSLRSVARSLSSSRRTRA